jgi:hypothetical protein
LPPGFRQQERERRRDALCTGETPLPRRRYPQTHLALVALAAAWAQLASAGHVNAQSSGASPFQPSLADPRYGQRFEPSDPTTPGMAPPSGAGVTGFESKTPPGKKKKPKPKPGEARPLPPPPPPPPGPPQFASGQTRAQQIPARAPYADAYKPPDAPPRRSLVPVQDPYEPLGVRLWSFVLKPSVEVTRGYDTNPSHSSNGKPSAYTLIEPGLKVQSQWSRHEFGLDLRGSYSDYDKNSSLNRPLIDAKTHSRIDLSHDTWINGESRFLLSTDYPGSPNLPADFAKLPIFTSYGSTTGLTHRFNRLELSGKASTDRTQYQDSKFTDGSTSSNHDRDFSQYGGAVRASYEVFPGVKPFVEVAGDVRRHDLKFDRDGFQRDSQALTPKIGSTFDMARRLTGEIAVGYLTRRFEDAALPELRGVVGDASLVWNVTGLTTATLIASSRAEETVLAGVSGALRRDIGVQVDHALRRWLIWTVRAGYGLDDYVGSLRVDNRLSAGSALTYKFTRELSVKAEYRYDQLRSNTSGSNYSANAFLVGLKLQR